MNNQKRPKNKWPTSKKISIFAFTRCEHVLMCAFTAAFSMFIICVLFFDCFSMNSSMSSSGSPQYNSYHDNVQNNRYYSINLLINMNMLWNLFSMNLLIHLKSPATTFAVRFHTVQSSKDPFTPSISINAAMMLATHLSLTTMESLENGL